MVADKFIKTKAGPRGIKAGEIHRRCAGFKADARHQCAFDRLETQQKREALSAAEITQILIKKRNI